MGQLPRQSVETLWGRAPLGVSALPGGTIGIGSARLAPLPVRTNLDGSYGFAAQDIATSIEQSLEPAGPLVSALRD